MLEGKEGNISLRGECGTGRVGLFFNAPKRPHGIRSVALLLELKQIEKNTGRERNHMGIVRFVARTETAIYFALTKANITKFLFVFGYWVAIYLQRPRSL